MKIRYALIVSRFGELLAIARDARLAGLYFVGQKDQPDIGELEREGAVRDDDWPVLAETRRQLAEYEAGRRVAFDLPIELAGTDFQRRVWAQLLDIPCGQTRSYADVARAAGSPRGVRATGAAIGRNPVSLVVPCHRVVGSDGSLTGYTGGLERKRALLHHERAI
ncbi:MAG: methylated-DNA--[protein]-cysteine S-methyltransferase [Burkholderiaceae bacterium]|jgi:methylated-DNA-[protein]-cysteine S-methyltransferase|nr:methylated-DNA--[protein]-cysteine S-methyltransferase [Burkholderiaceae bacterium]